MDDIMEQQIAEKLEALVLRSGGHKAPPPGADAEMCAMEAVAWLAGEPWSAVPQCACPVIAAFMRSWNDCIRDDGLRTRMLKPFLVRLLGTKSTAGVEERRSLLALDWLIRVQTPMWLGLRSELKAHAETLRGLSAIVDIASAREAGPRVRAASAAARDATSAAARDAASAAARDATSAAACDAAWAAARAAASDAASAAASVAACDAAWAAAWAAAWDAVWDAAAWDAAWVAARDAASAAASAAASDALAPTVRELQNSAADLLKRMIDVS